MLVFSYVATATPIYTVELLAWSPTIISPTLMTVWERNSTQTVLWETNNIPEEEQNSTGLLLLGYMENMSENLDIEHPLAANFPIVDGQVSITVPQNCDASRQCYCLFGDSGNASPEFVIT
ncbi:uncharacterized protein EDB91DRAFT_1064839 [Suillus paluster]|uniref:uncharacterized protein n=1 Tax=Suillus paluster TaxID=48578 RepID=UPI001B87F073|nr:uncharacterized protein EDB91DRAFT_1064839 [Suillus paluster]KAG1720508.1 hypothetical protein EDB91DRAFT_1064839 [Suillus paluster]